MKAIYPFFYVCVLCCFFVVFTASSTTVSGAPAQPRGLVSATPPKNPKLAEGIAAALDGDFEKATQLFAEDRKNRPDARPGGIDAAMAFLSQPSPATRFGKMRYWLEKTAEDFPNDPEAFLLLANIAQREDRLLECIMLTQKAKELLNDFATETEIGKTRKTEMTVTVETLLSAVAEQKERWPEAIDHLNTLCQLEPDNADHRYQLGLVYFRSGNKEKAAEMLHQAEEIDPTQLPALVILAQLSESAGDREAAQQYLKQVLAEHGDSAHVLLAAAEMELNWASLARVRELVQAAKEIQPNAIDTAMMMGIVHLYAEEFELAEREFRLITQSSPKNASALMGLTLALVEQDDPQKLRRAFEIAKKNADEHPGSVDALTTWAWVLIHIDDLNAAEEILMGLFDSHDLNSPGAYYLAEILARTKRKDEAILFLESALETQANYPKKEAAQKLLRALKPASATEPESPPDSATESATEQP